MLSSLRREFMPTFERLLASPNTSVKLEIGSQHLPLWLATRSLEVVSGEAVLVVDVDPGAFAMSVNNVPVREFKRVPRPAPYGGLPAVRIDQAFAGGLLSTHTITVTAAGGLASAGAPARLDPARLKDILLVVVFNA